MNFRPLAFALVVAACPVAASAANLYMIDIDSTDPAGPISTESGWTSLDATGGDGSSVEIDGVSFSIFSAQGSRLRLSGGNPNPDPLLGDFVFDEAGGNAAVGVRFGGAGDLAAGTWRVTVWSWDQTVAGLETQGALLDFRRNDIEGDLDVPINPTASGAAGSFTFESDGIGRYDFFVRENNDNNRTRLNAFTLELIPEPGASAFIALGGLGLILRRRRHLS